MDGLAALDEGKAVAIDFISTPDVDGFCKAHGFRRSWAGRKLDDLAPTDRATGAAVVAEDEARIVRDLLLRMLKEGRLQSRDSETPMDAAVLGDFADGAEGGLWEFGFALAVELEHGRTRGANVTNNHPLLTGLVVLAHLGEDSLYYARLMVMELEAS